MNSITEWKTQKKHSVTWKMELNMNREKIDWKKF